VPNLHYEVINGEKQDFFEGISLVPAPGHSAGLQVPILDSRELGKIFIDSDVINTQMNLEKRIVGGIHWDSVKAYESMLKIIDLLKRTEVSFSSPMMRIGSSLLRREETITSSFCLAIDSTAGCAGSHPFYLLPLMSCSILALSSASVFFLSSSLQV
jgi:hypothetical protein